MRKVFLLLGVLVFVVVSLAQSYISGQMVRSATETDTYHGVERKIVVYGIRKSMTIYTVTQGTAEPSELAGQALVEFRMDEKNKGVMYIKDKSGKEVKYSIIRTTSWAR